MLTLYFCSHASQRCFSLRQQKKCDPLTWLSPFCPHFFFPKACRQGKKNERERDEDGGAVLWGWKARDGVHVCMWLWIVTYDLYKSNCPSVWGQRLPLVSPFPFPHLSINGGPNLLLPVAVIQPWAGGSLSANTPPLWHLLFTINVAFQSKDSQHPGGMKSFTPYFFRPSTFHPGDVSIEATATFIPLLFSSAGPSPDLNSPRVLIN